ncbi:MAG: DUF1499 domain-containing protein [Halorhodospira sp.]
MRLLLLLPTMLFLVGCSTTTSTMTEGGPEPLVYEESYDAVWRNAIDAITSLNWRINHTEKDSGIINADTPTSMSTWGDTIRFRVKKTNNEKVQIDASSTTEQTIDWGKNTRNIEKAFNEIDKRINKNSNG